MSRLSAGAVLVLSLAALACKASGPPSGESPRRMPDAPDALGAAVEVPPPDPREAALAATVLGLFETEHLRRRTLDDTLSRAAFATYVEQLDAGKMFLLQSDAAALGKHADQIDDQLRSGSLDLAHDGAKLFAARVVVVGTLVQELLASRFDSTNEEFIEVDPEKVELAKTELDLRDRWRRRLELEVLERVAGMEARLAPPKKDGKDAGIDESEPEAAATPIAQIPTTREGREVKARADLLKAYDGRFARLRTPGPLDAAADLVNAVGSVLDPHTTYLPPADKANFDIQMTGSLEGIGAVLRERDHYIEVTELVPGGASWRQGRLAAGDLILSVTQDGKDPVEVVDMRIDEVVKMIRGKKGTVVRLRVQKPTGDEETVAITRDVVVLEESYARGAVLTRKGQPAFGYIYLPSFYGGQGNGQRTAAGDVRKLLRELKGRKVGGVIIDIRSNGGGFLNDAVEMTGLLVDRGPVVQVQDSADRREVLADDEPGTEYDGQVVVLVDRFSASASEIVAGALQDYQRAVVVGTAATHGKGTVQSLANLDRATGGAIELGVLKITVQQFFRVNGASTQREGVMPDILLPDPAGHLTDIGERSLDHAIEWSQIDPAKHVDWPLATWKKELLVKRSAERISKHAGFAKVAASSALMKARRDDTLVPLALPAWEARRKAQRAALEAASPELDQVGPRFQVALLDAQVAAVAPRPGGGKADDRATRWRDGLARDPWVEESLFILGDMTRGPAAK